MRRCLKRGGQKEEVYKMGPGTCATIHTGPTYPESDSGFGHSPAAGAQLEWEQERDRDGVREPERRAGE